MKNHWLDRKKACNKKWKRVEMISNYGHHFIMDDFDCEMEDGKITSKKCSDKIKWNTEFDFTQK